MLDIWFGNLWFQYRAIVFWLLYQFLLRFWLKQLFWRILCRNSGSHWLLLTYSCARWSFCWRFDCTLGTGLDWLLLNIDAFVDLWRCIYRPSMWTCSWERYRWWPSWLWSCRLFNLLFNFIFLSLWELTHIFGWSLRNFSRARKGLVISFLHISFFLCVNLISYPVLCFLLIQICRILLVSRRRLTSFIFLRFLLLRPLDSAQQATNWLRIVVLLHLDRAN